MIYRVPIRTLPDVRKVGHIRYPSGWQDSYNHKWDVLIFVLSGEFIYTFHERPAIKLTAGMHLLIPAGTAYTVTAGEDCDYYYIHFRCTEPLRAVPEHEVIDILRADVATQKRAQSNDYDTPPRDALYPAETAWHKDRIRNLQYRISRCAEFRRGTAALDRMRLLNAFMKVLISLSSTTGEQLLDTKPLSPTLIKITRYIEENYTSPLSLQQLSASFALSKQYIMRLFREQLGVTVTHYINEIRLRKATELLTFHSLSVSEVAYAVGFSSLYYFDRVFKKFYALTPSEYQKGHRPIASTMQAGQ